MDIYLIRHGRQELSNCNEDVSLSLEGQRQAKLTGRRMKATGIEALYSSDLKRAEETADIISGFVNLNVNLRHELREISFGHLEGHSQVYIDEHFAEFNRRFYTMDDDLCYPGGESGADVVQRAMPVIREIELTGVSKAAVVTHGGTIRAILCHILGISLGRRILIGAPLEHCSISILRKSSKKGWCVHSVNDSSHLC